MLLCFCKSIVVDCKNFFNFFSFHKCTLPTTCCMLYEHCEIYSRVILFIIEKNKDVNREQLKVKHFHNQSSTK